MIALVSIACTSPPQAQPPEPQGPAPPAPTSPEPEPTTPSTDTPTGSTGDTAPPPVDPCAGTLACWRFEQQAGTGTPDDSGNGYSLNLVGGALLGDDVPAVDGVSNTHALELAGSPSSAGRPVSGSALAGFPSGVTVEAWVRPDVLPIPADGAGTRARYVLWMDDNVIGIMLASTDVEDRLHVTLNAELGATGPCTIYASVPWVEPVGTWSCISATYAAERLDIYVDGVLRDTFTAPSGCGSVVGPTDELRVGIDETHALGPTHSRGWVGGIDEVRISAGALAAADLACVD